MTQRVTTRKQKQKQKHTDLALPLYNLLLLLRKARTYWDLQYPETLRLEASRSANSPEP